VILFSAAVTAGLTALSQGRFVPGLTLALAGSFYVLATAIWGVIEHEASPHHTAVTAADLLLITTIVWLTGGVRSEYYLLYYLPVLCAALRLNVRDGIAASVLAGVLYSFVALAGEAHANVLTPAPYRVLAVCISAVVMVMLFALLRREVRLCESLRDALHSSLNRVAAIYDVAHAANTGAELAAVLSILLDHSACITRAASRATRK
jgi:K+-sensing histidine kinase KdpD